MRSDPLKKGINAAPQRALLKALGLCDAEIERPLIGVVSSQNDIVPGHVFLDKITDAVKQGVALGGGVPIVFPAIAVCDGLAMGHKGMKYSLVSRELIADSVEAMATAHPFDGLVMVAACDKNVPGLLMAAARLNIPSIVISGGAMLAGRACGRKLSYSDISEGVSRFRTGQIDAKTFLELENKSCPTCGSCSGMFTANSMNCLTEVLGMALPGNGTIPAVMSARYRLAKEAGLAVMELVRNNVCPRDIMTKEAFENALTVDMALGCSTNSMLHLPAIAHECGFELDLTEANAISARTPNLCHLAPAGHRYIEELDEAGGIPAVMNELVRTGLLHTNLPTVTGKTVGENIEGREILDAEVIRPVSDPFSKEGGIAVLKGNVAPDGCVVKRSAVAPEMLMHTGSGRARRFEFANGLKLVIIEDPSLTGRTTLNLRLAGGTSAVDHGLLAVPAALTLPMRSGIGSLTAADIRRVARDAKVSVMSYAEQLHHGIRAEADPEGVPAMMAILHARLSAPRFDEKALADMRRDRIRDLEHAPAERRFMDAIARDAFTAGGTMVAGRDDVDALASTEKLSALEAKLLGDPSRMTVTIVTRESVEKTYEEAAPWLASLAKRGEGFEFWRDQGVRPASGTGVKVWPWATADKAMVQMHYRSAMPWSEADADRLSLIGYAANRALRESLRTKASGVYVVNLNPLLVKEPAPYFIGRLNFTSAPARAEDGQSPSVCQGAIHVRAREGRGSGKARRRGSEDTRPHGHRRGGLRGAQGRVARAP